MIKKLLKNEYIFALFAKILCVVLGFAYTILISRYLGAELRGEYSIVQNYATIISSIICLGIYQAYPFFKKKIKNEDEKKELYLNISKNIVGLFLVYSVICLLGAILLPLNIRIRITLLILPTAFLYKQLNYIVMIENPKLCNLADIILSVFDIVTVGLLMIFTKANIWICFGFLVIDKFVYALLPYKNLKINFIKNPPKIDKQMKEYIKYGFLPMLTIFLMYFNHKVDIVMLSFFDNVTTAEIGIYSLGVMLAEKVWVLPDTLTNILQSKLTKGKKEDEVAKISRISFFVTLIALIAIVIVGKPLINIAYGSEYSDAYQITLIILFGVLGMIFYKVIYSYNVVVGKKRINFVLLTISVLINVILNGLLINYLGMIGAGYASLISFVLCGLSFLISFSKSTKTKIIDMIILKKEDIKLLKSLVSKKEGKLKNEN